MENFMQRFIRVTWSKLTESSILMDGQMNYLSKGRIKESEHHKSSLITLIQKFVFYPEKNQLLIEAKRVYAQIFDPGADPVAPAPRQTL